MRRNAADRPTDDHVHANKRPVSLPPRVGKCMRSHPRRQETCPTKKGGWAQVRAAVPTWGKDPPLIAALPSAKGLVAGPSRSRHQG